jgi:hypothetical protein
VSIVLVDEALNADSFVQHILGPTNFLQIVEVGHKQKKMFVLGKDNPPIHKEKIPRAKLSQMPLHLAPHPPYSPDLAPSDFFLFGALTRKCSVLNLIPQKN